MHVYNVNNPLSGNPTHYEMTIVDLQVLYAAASAEADEKSQRLLSPVAGVGR
jgi:hypothetical protein